MNKGRAINERDLKSVLVHLDGLSTSENIITYIRDTLIKSVIIHTHTHMNYYTGWTVYKLNAFRCQSFLNKIRKDSLLDTSHLWTLNNYVWNIRNMLRTIQY